MADNSSYPRLTNVTVLDDQHGYLLDGIRRLEAEMAGGKGASTVPSLLDDLERYAEAHFWTEERLMQSIEYPLRDTHAVEHERVRLWLKDLRRQQGDALSAVRLLGGLRDWLEAHIKKWDGELGVYLNAQGIH